MNIRATAHIKGRVQGVFYRQSTMEKARRLGLTGWVRNLPDGSVEAVIEGQPPSVRELIDWCRQGPAAARVTSVDIDWSDASGEFSRFTIR